MPAHVVRTVVTEFIGKVCRISVSRGPLQLLNRGCARRCSGVAPSPPPTRSSPAVVAHRRPIDGGAVRSSALNTQYSQLGADRGEARWATTAGHG